MLRREGGGYILYYTAGSAGEGRQCLGHAVSDAPEGPFVDQIERPCVCQVRDEAIGASPCVEENGELWLLWKNDGNAVGPVYPGRAP